MRRRAREVRSDENGAAAVRSYSGSEEPRDCSVAVKTISTANVLCLTGCKQSVVASQPRTDSQLELADEDILTNFVCQRRVFTGARGAQYVVRKLPAMRRPESAASLAAHKAREISFQAAPTAIRTSPYFLRPFLHLHYAQYFTLSPTRVDSSAESGSLEVAAQVPAVRQGLGIVERVEFGVGGRVRLLPERHGIQSTGALGLALFKRARGVEKKGSQRVTVEGRTSCKTCWACSATFGTWPSKWCTSSCWSCEWQWNMGASGPSQSLRASARGGASSENYPLGGFHGIPLVHLAAVNVLCRVSFARTRIASVRGDASLDCDERKGQRRRTGLIGASLLPCQVWWYPMACSDMPEVLPWPAGAVCCFED